MTPEEKEAAFSTAETRAGVLLDLHSQVVQYCVDHNMTSSELASLIAGLLVSTAHQNELGEAIGNVVSKVLSYLPSHSGTVIRLPRLQPAQQRKTELTGLLKMLLGLHIACINGVTAREAVVWMKLPFGRSSETTVGKMLKTLGYKRYRRNTTAGREHRLFPEGKQPEGWTL